MNLNDKNIDELFRDAANNSQSPDFKDAYWDEMQAVLAEQKNTKRAYILDLAWWVIGLVSLSTFTLFLVIIPTANSNGKIANGASLDNHQVAVNQQNLNGKELTKGDGEVQRNADPINSNDLIPDKKESLPQRQADVMSSIDKQQNASQLIMNNAERTSTTAGSRGQKEKIFTPKASRGESDSAVASDEELNSDEFSRTTKDEFPQSKATLSLSTRLSPKTLPLKTFEEDTEGLVLMPLRRVRAEHSFGLDLGLSFAEAYQGNTSSSNRFSLGAMYSLDYNNFILRTGAGITVERSSNLSVREESMVYSYTATKFENVLDYKMFTEFYVPLEIGYRFNNTTFGAGGQFNVLLGTRMSHIEKINDEVVNSRILTNRTEGLNSLTGGAYLWVQQHLNARLIAGVRIGRNIGSRVQENAYLNDISRPTPIFGQIYVSYQLFRK